jgi:REP element-mobilizing transposase RayT
MPTANLYEGYQVSKIIGCMLTWTTYGTWLQWDERGYVKDGKILCENKELHAANLKKMKCNTIYLNQQQRLLVHEAICCKAQQIGQVIRAFSVSNDHVHIVVERAAMSIEKSAGIYKKAGTDALRKSGLAGKVWTRGYDKRFCFDEEDLWARIHYVKKHSRSCND